MDIRVQFGRVLRRWRVARGLTQEELAARANTASVYISDLERGVYNPTLAVVFELARALEVDPSELVKEIPPHARLEGPRGRRVRRR